MRLRHIIPTEQFANHCFLRFDCRPLHHVQCYTTFWLRLRLWLFLSMVTFTLHSCVMFLPFSGFRKRIFENSAQDSHGLKPKDLLAILLELKFDGVRFWHLYCLAEPGDAQQQTLRAGCFSFATNCSKKYMQARHFLVTRMSLLCTDDHCDHS